MALTVATLLGAPGKEPAPPTEYQLKAAFLYNLFKFVEWPAAGANTNAPLILGIVGQDPFKTVIDGVLQNAKPIDGRPVQVRRVKPGPELLRCEVLFIGSSEQLRLPAILDSLQRASVLTVGDMDGFCERGGIINLKMVEQSVRLEVNPAAGERAGLKLSSRLLRLATIITALPDKGQ